MPKKDFNDRWLQRVKFGDAARAEEKEPAENCDREDYLDNRRGLGLRVYRSEKKVWFVVYRKNGERKIRRFTLEPYPQMSLADAHERAQEIHLAVKRGEDPAEEKKIDKAAPTFKELAAAYLERHAMANKRSWKEDKRVIDRELNLRWESRKAHEIRRRDVIALLDDIKDRDAPIQANRTLALVRKIYNWGIERDLVETNPCLQVKRVVQEHQRDRVLSEDEIRQVWAAIEALAISEEDDPKSFKEIRALMVGMFKLRFLTAQRGGEIESMRWADVDLDSGWWTIPAHIAKNKLSHRVPLAPAAVSILEALREITGKREWVFPSQTRKGQHIANIQKAAQRVRDLAGVEFVMHDLRRTAASYMTSAKVPRLVVSKVLNHVETGVTRVYDRHSYDNEKREALETWAGLLDQIIKAKPAELKPVPPKAEKPAKPKARTRKPTRQTKKPAVTAKVG